ncbi:MAG: N-acetyl-gamma-glutamyl-phosphate reductase [Sphaerochaetaceae bacterium]
MITVGVIGATGYAGSELMRLLVAHPNIQSILCGSHSHAGSPYQSVYPNFGKIYHQQLDSADIAQMADRCDVLFLSLPHGISSHQLNSEILKKCLIIDLGADYRLKDVAVYEQWYNTSHGSAQLLNQAVYGLSELYRSDIAASRLIANPGCYTTTAILTLHPLLYDRLIESKGIIIDAKSGVSGAGRGEKLDSLYCEVNETLKAYAVGTHRHTVEIEEQLALSLTHGKSIKDVVLQFTPHLVPMNRGILATVYANLQEGVGLSEIEASYKKHYDKEQFIRMLEPGVFPQTRWVKSSNYVDIGFTVDKRTNRLIACGALDNLVKGAAGQAVQNMNIALGFAESAGIDMIAPFPL